MNFFKGFLGNNPDKKMSNGEIDDLEKRLRKAQNDADMNAEEVARKESEPTAS